MAIIDIEKENKGENKGEIEWHQSGSESSPMLEHSSTPTRHSSVASSGELGMCPEHECSCIEMFIWDGLMGLN